MNGTGPASQQTGAKLVDDFLRRELGVGDPSNAIEMATALRTRYAADASRIDQEQSGFALAFPIDMAPVVVGPSSRGASWESEAVRAQSALEIDLDTLMTAPGNRERRLELKGWRES